MKFLFFCYRTATPIKSNNIPNNITNIKTTIPGNTSNLDIAVLEKYAKNIDKKKAITVIVNAHFKGLSFLVLFFDLLFSFKIHSP